MSSWTAFPDLDLVLEDLRQSARRILGRLYVGMYLQGSFALGAGDAQSDADFIVVVGEPPAGAALTQLRELHDDIPTRPGIWNMNLEGSYADASSLRTSDGLGVPWLFNNRGHRSLGWDTHCNALHTRWILRHHGITLDGPPPADLIDEVPADALRRAALSALPGTVDDIFTWADPENAWTQKYVVQTFSRMLYTAVTGQVAAKPQALDWAAEQLDPSWRPLLRQVAADRSLPWRPIDPPRPGSMERALEYARYVEREAARLTG